MWEKKQPPEAGGLAQTLLLLWLRMNMRSHGDRTLCTPCHSRIVHRRNSREVQGEALSRAGGDRRPRAGGLGRGLLTDSGLSRL